MAVLDSHHLLRVSELGIELARIGHEGGRVHHAPWDARGIGDLWEAVAIVIWDSGLVHPGAHDCRRRMPVLVEPIW